MHRHFTTKLLKKQVHRCQKIQPKSRGFPRSFRCFWSFLTYPGPQSVPGSYTAFYKCRNRFTSPAKTWTRVHLHVRSVADYTSGHHVRNHSMPFSRNTYAMAINDKGSFMQRINKVLHTDSLVCRIDWCQTRNKTRHYCWNFWQKSL